MKVLKIGLPLILAISLVLGITLPGMAASEPEEIPPEEVQTDNATPWGSPPAWGWRLPRMQAGEVVEKVVGIDGGQSYLVIQRGEQEPVQIAVDDGTEYFKVSAPGRVDDLLQNRMALRQRNQAQASDIKPAEPANMGRLMRNRMAPKHRIEGVADDTEPGAPMKPGLLNAARLRKSNGFGQMVSRPMANPELIPVNGEDEDVDAQGWGERQRFHQFGEEATLDDIEVGDRVAVRLVPGQEKPVARLVLIFEQATHDYNRIAGTITDVSSDNQTITIAPANDAEPVTLHYNENTVFNLEGTITVVAGQLAHAVYHAEDMMAKVVRVWLEGSAEFGIP